MTKKAKILSIDGGGIRGILPGIIVEYIESELQRMDGADKRISDYFDLIAGTSTGGILTLLYLAPNESGKRPKYTAQEAVDIYLTKGDEIFDVSVWQRIKSGHGITDEKYSANALEKALNDYFGDTRLSELLKPCLITAYDIRNRSAKFFNKLDTVSDVKDFYIKDIARATSAAPTYFETARINSVFGAPYSLIDGGVFANNPVMCAYAEARSIDFATVSNNPEKPNCPSTDEIMILSIGTGSQEKPYYYEEAKDWGVVGWIKPIIDILMSGNSETVDYQLSKIYCQGHSPNECNYIRIEPHLVDSDSAMDNGTNENIKALEYDGKQYVEQNKEFLDAVIRRIRE